MKTLWCKNLVKICLRCARFVWQLLPQADFLAKIFLRVRGREGGRASRRKKVTAFVLQLTAAGKIDCSKFSLL